MATTWRNLRISCQRGSSGDTCVTSYARSFRTVKTRGSMAASTLSPMAAQTESTASTMMLVCVPVGCASLSQAGRARMEDRMSSRAVFMFLGAGWCTREFPLQFSGGGKERQPKFDPHCAAV
jgi:hypothetical protein